jgi:hypothetical protein
VVQIKRWIYTIVKINVEVEVTQKRIVLQFIESLVINGYTRPTVTTTTTHASTKRKYDDYLHPLLGSVLQISVYNSLPYNFYV